MNALAAIFVRGWTMANALTPGGSENQIGSDPAVPRASRIRCEEPKHYEGNASMKKREKNNDRVLCTEGRPVMIWKCVHGNIVKMRCCGKHLEQHNRNDHGCSPLTTCKQCDQDMVRHPSSRAWRRIDEVEQTVPPAPVAVLPPVQRLASWGV